MCPTPRFDISHNKNILYFGRRSFFGETMYRDCKSKESMQYSFLFLLLYNFNLGFQDGFIF